MGARFPPRAHFPCAKFSTFATFRCDTASKKTCSARSSQSPLRSKLQSHPSQNNPPEPNLTQFGTQSSTSSTLPSCTGHHWRHAMRSEMRTTSAKSPCRTRCESRSAATQVFASPATSETIGCSAAASQKAANSTKCAAHMSISCIF